MSEFGILVGRDAERAAFGEMLDRLDRGQPAWLSIVGEPGIGKTRLLAELALMARARDHLVLGGRGSEFERDLPFGVWIDALDDHVAAHGVGPSGWDGLGDELVAILPSAVTGDARSPLTAERHRTFQGVRGVLGAIAADRPLVLILDDLHWADPASVELLGYLVRRPPPGPTLVAAAFRDGIPPAGLEAALEVAVRDIGGATLRPGPLTVAESATLLGDVASQDQLDRLERLHLYSGGNPFYLLQLSRSSVEPSVEATTVPAAVAAALRAELDALGEDARELAMGAAIAGEPFDLDLAGQAAGLSETGRLKAIDRLVTSGLVRQTEATRRFRFRHPILRQVTYECAAPGWRIAAHRRLVEALPDHPSNVAARAHHHERSAGVGDLEAVSALLVAARASASAPVAAIRWYRATLRLLPAEASGRRLEALTALADTLVSIGRLDEGRDVLVEALGLPLEVTVHAQLTAACAAVELLLGEPSAAEARLTTALSEVPKDAADVAAELRLELAGVAWFTGTLDTRARRIDAALATARQCGEPELVALGLAHKSYLLCMAGTATQAWQARTGADQLLERHGEARASRRLDALYYLGHAETWGEDYPRATRHLEHAIALSRSSGNGKYLVMLLAGLVYALDARGRLVAAATTADEALETARGAGLPHLLGFASWCRAWTAATAGDLSTAMELGQRATTLAAAHERTVISAAAHGHFAAICLQAGEFDRCLVELDRAGAPEFDLFAIGRRCVWYRAGALAELARGDRAAAEVWVGRGEAFGDEAPAPVGRTIIQRARAELLLHDGQPAAAAELAHRAAVGAESADAVIEAARSRIVQGRAMVATGDIWGATSTLSATEAVLARCGAEHDRALADAELRHLAPAREQQPPGDLGGLTERERKIAELVAAGHCNREVGVSLFLSERTVAGAVERILAKSGLHSTTGLSALLGREHR